MRIDFSALKERFRGELHTDKLLRAIYATDASVYKEWPDAVAYPRDEADVAELVRFCHQHKTPLIPRSAGTSLAGQCVGKGIVVDISRHMTSILDFDAEKGIIRVQPGVIRDELNAFVREKGWFFGPNTSTANRCMIGGMVGNNSSGTTSIRYGTTRDKVKSIRAVMSDGSICTFSSNSEEESNVYEKAVQKLLAPPEIRENIRSHYPKTSIHRRNTGYAVDVIAQQKPFVEDGADFNLAKLLCGSEGTLAFSTEITLQLDPLPPPEILVLAIHFSSIHECMEATPLVMEFEPYACELMDKIILDCTKENREQMENRFFVEGDPAAILAVELRSDTTTSLQNQAGKLISTLKKAKKGYAFPLIWADDVPKVWNLRAAGLGLLSNIPGPKKALACIEDTAVDLHDLPDYIAEFESLMDGFGQRAVYYAHAGAGELHLRPILNLRDPVDLKQFRAISTASAQLVKKYNGSLSGEHGDGRVRAEFIPLMIGETNYALLREIKQLFDPLTIFNPGKIIDAPPMDTALREDPEHPLPQIDTFFDFKEEGGFMAAVEKCNGSADCRKSASSGGTMCPSYQVSKEEKHSTRARANALREFITESTEGKMSFAHPELKEVLDLCLSCKACARECPSNVDMSAMKAEWQYQYHKQKGLPLRTRLLGSMGQLNGLIAPFSFLINPLSRIKLLKKSIGLAADRSLPVFHRKSVHQWFLTHAKHRVAKPRKTVYIFLDEFTDYLDVEIGKKAIALLWQLNYDIHWVKHPSSARSHISKGLLEQARKIVDKNVTIFSEVVDTESPLIGIEPSAILGFRDEFPRLASEHLREKAKKLAANTFMIDEFLAMEARAGHISQADFIQQSGKIQLHGHCHQKALSSLRYTREVLSLSGYEVNIIPSGCCGMAGSFGYEKEHYQISMDIGEMVLFPAIRSQEEDTIIIAPGTSCRHQIADGTGRRARHWVEVVMLEG